MTVLTMPTILPSRGTSNIATYIDEESQKSQAYFSNTAAFSKQAVFNELTDTWEECQFENWDGYNAYPVVSSTLSYAYAFIQALPLGFHLPSIGAEPDGHLTFEWYRHTRWILSVSISPESMLYYAALFGTSSVTGSEPFFCDSIPASILDLIKKVYST